MEPVLVSCDGCGARIRVTRPDAAREVRCPRCGMALGPTLPPMVSDAALEPAPAEDRSRPPVRLAVLSALGMALVTSALSFGFIVGARPVAVMSRDETA